MIVELEPGRRVRPKGAEDWRLGQVRSVGGTRAAVNVEHAGKRPIDLRRGELPPAARPL